MLGALGNPERLPGGGLTETALKGWIAGVTLIEGLLPHTVLRLCKYKLLILTTTPRRKLLCLKGDLSAVCFQ